MIRTRFCGTFAALLLVPLVLTCSQVRQKSHESQFCSTHASDDPLFECSLSEQDLLCIGTYKKGPTTVYVCRVACTITADCAFADDVCCQGPIYGRNFNKTGGCVPSGKCMSASGGSPDAGVTADAGVTVDTRSAGIGDAPLD